MLVIERIRTVEPLTALIGDLEQVAARAEHGVLAKLLLHFLEREPAALGKADSHNPRRRIYPKRVPAVKPRSIGARLTLWYASVTALTLLAFCAGVFWAVSPTSLGFRSPLNRSRRIGAPNAAVPT